MFRIDLLQVYKNKIYINKTQFGVETPLGRKQQLTKSPAQKHVIVQSKMAIFSKVYLITII
jgi:hypothetical protein